MSNKNLIVFLIALLLTACSQDIPVGSTVAMANSNGICGEYLGYKIGHLVKDKKTGHIYAANDGQPIVQVSSCD